MKKIFCLIWILLSVWMAAPAQTYVDLWKKVENARRKDLPQTALRQVEIIGQRAYAEHLYGQLMKATLLEMQLKSSISPDSLPPAVEQLDAMARRSDDEVLRAVCHAVLSQLYERNHSLSDEWQTLSKDYKAKALARPELLAHVAAKDYVPLVVEEADDDIFNHDMLGIIGRELDAWDVLHRYYEQSGNRRAACISALRLLQQVQHNEEGRSGADKKWQECPYVASHDSLLRQYADLAEAGEVAISRYDCMSQCNGTPVADLVDYIDQATRQWSRWKRIDQLKAIRRQLTNPQFAVQVERREMLPGQPQQLLLREVRHVEKVTLRIYRTRLKGNHTLDVEQSDDYQKIKNGLTELVALRQTKDFGTHRDYELFADSLLLPALSEGIYMLELSGDHGVETKRMLYHVTNLRTMAFAQPDNNLRIVVVNATTGQPVAGAKVQISESGKPLRTLTTNRQGEAILAAAGRYRWMKAYVTTASDQALPPVSLANTYYFSGNDSPSTQAKVFTDRAIYRPGETVYAAAIVYQLTGADATRAVAHRQMTAKLLDANSVVVEEKNVTTDDFGKCHTHFTLPTQRLSGYYKVVIDRWRTSFRVEEYKRPTFEVTFRDYKNAYQAGDTVTLTADVKSYAGVSLPGARVRYQVQRKMPFWWRVCRWRPETDTEGDAMLVDSTAVTAADGTFSVRVPLVIDRSAFATKRFYSFEVTADVTDVNGETQQATASLPLGTRAAVLTCDLEEQVRADQLKSLTFTRRNAAGQAIDGQVRYRFDQGAWHEAAANVPADLSALHLSSGKHQLHAICQGDTLQQSTVVFSIEDRRPATETHDWFYVSDKQFPADGRPVTLQVGSSDADLHIVYEICAGEKVLESGFWHENHSLCNRQLTYQPAYGDGILVAVAWVKDGVTYHHMATVQRPVEDKHLTMKWKTFRNRLLPGQQEEWQLTIAEPNGKPAHAELMAVVYDKSLDQLERHQWTFQPQTRIALPYSRWMTTDLYNIWCFSAAKNTARYPEPLMFGHVDASLYPYRHIAYFEASTNKVGGMELLENVTVASKVGTMSKRKGIVRSGVAMDMDGAQDKVYEAVEELPQEKNDGGKPSLRTNLQSTACFAPALTTDSTGTVSLRFTLPEALTTWRVMALAHTQEMHTGLLTDEAVAQKQLMVQPNMPRFVREGDEAQVAARVSNLADRALQGRVQLLLTDAETGQTVMTEVRPFSVEKGQTSVVAFRYRPDGSRSLLVCRMTASAEGYSDGEQHYLPVLPNRERVTVTRPITQHGKGTQTIDIAALFPKQTRQQRLTIEYAQHPAWMMVQSLMAQSETREENAIGQAASLYANLLAQRLVADHPQIQGIVEQWKRETGEETPLDANLAKDASLKDLMLNETPWVAEARSETAQRQALATFFDASQMRQRTDLSLQQLRKLQLANGGFAWYGGMQASPYVTISVAEMLARLENTTGTKGSEAPLLQRAMHYMDGEVAKIVAQLKRNDTKAHPAVFPSAMVLQWLYVNAITGRNLTSAASESSRYLIALLKKETRRQSIYEKALTTVVLHQQGSEPMARSYAQSLKEYSVYQEETGRYYDTPRAGYSWQSYRIPTVVAAIEALRLTMPSDVQTIDEMRRWLLQEKRTQQWDTPLNTINAIYAFVDGTSALSGSRMQTTLSIDGQPLEMGNATAGIGYRKTVIDHPQGKQLTIAKTSDDTSWGAVYAQFMQKASDVKSSAGGIKVMREVVGGKKAYQVGDRIKVRITIQTPRDLDFVEVIDRKAACMEPVSQLSGYHRGAFCAPKDGGIHYFFDQMPKGKHVIETEYFIDRQGSYTTGTCTAQCAYAPEYRATCPSMTLTVK